MSTTLDPARVIGHKVIDADGHKIGQADEVYLDDSTGTPQWVTVKGGLFGGKGHFAPLGGAVLVDDQLRLAYPKAKVDSAPELETGRHLSVEEEMTLYQHYGLGHPEKSGTGTNIGTGTGMGTGMGTGTGTGTDSARGMDAAAGTAAGTAMSDHAGAHGSAGINAGSAGMNAGSAGMTAGSAGMMAAPTGMGRLGTTDAGPEATPDRMAMGSADGRVMTRYEERLHVGTERVEARQARLRKTVTTEHVERTVPLTHQEIRVEREPIAEGERDSAMGTADFADADLDVTLYEERPVVTKEVVAVERVRLMVEEVTEQVTVQEEVRAERIDLVGDAEEDPRNRM
ncbi:PRC and DUF2382 domain-containing protein [Streptacidiphilus carbonis]|uniref:PRC and DUF2382 domain-containing protein n=1 Tax=Streptacidiphilus carbonis TaxID=105422 RepID=UPI0005A5FB24|nr:PRC and DUF2382 domain-containing protein [Streptacidiphilus carbonis]